ncbi:MAG: nucleotidyltransferase family protein [Deltaproteobacteria bacterium]|nr:nucleotidyltransferase family protein [Deltaproteobacteria bacterium]
MHKKTKLKAFLLVAGRGEKLSPLTDSIPKCLLPIAGVPLLQIWLENLVQAGIDEVLINTHWLHEKVEEFVGKWSSRNNKIQINLFHEPVLLGSAGTLLANRNWAGTDPFFIIYGDNLTRLNLHKMLGVHKTCGLPLTIRIYRGADSRKAGIVCIDENYIVTDFEEKPDKPKSDLGAGAIYIADSRIFNFFPPSEEAAAGGVLDLSYHVLPRMAGQMKAYDSGEFSLDIGTPDAYATAQEIWAEMNTADG